ncbi:hypothetical protein [Microbacterium sp. KSW4-4]|uniref:hypothetical protein n=1 Tax=Microbacterium sp. KSW4-4 TaxID=2851651 RepID=UPI001FFD405F|nr:hypothetical protein [Microbacterium sp. KSW4-4]MCK2034475.1 hypothetical protein [Microbacterium sp. KSW4-4]
MPNPQGASAAERSTRPLSEVARHVVAPSGIVDSVWFELEERFDEWNIRFDAWQDGAGQLLLGTRESGKYAATVGGSTLSIARQVAKTFLVSRTTFGLCTYEDDQTWLWTAHRVRTATQTFQKMAGFAQHKRVRPYLAPGATNGIRSANGEQEIRFRNGSRILFGAREAGFGRGFDEVDGEVFDEAQILTEKALEDMIPAMNQSRNPRGAMAVFMGTPPRPTDPGEVMKARRRKALSVAPAQFSIVTHGDALYIECSADADVGRPGGPSLDDPEQIKLANPSYPHRTPPESIARMRENLVSDEAWRREALGVWDDDTQGARRWSDDFWSSCGTNEAPADGVRSFAVAFSLDGKSLAVAGASKTDELVHVEIVDAARVADGWSIDDGLEPLADWLAARKERTAQISILGKAGVSLVTALKEKGVPSSMIHAMTTGDYFSANAMTENAIREKRVSRPFGEAGDVLDAAVAVCDAKTRGSGWGWIATVPDVDKEPLEAFCAAYWAARTTKRVPGRKQVLL